MKIISRATWGAKAWKGTPDAVPLSRRTEFFVHYDGGNPITRTGNAIPRAIEAEHLANGWAGIGYNFVVDQAGNIYEGRGWNLQGAHCPNHNVTGIGVQIAIGGDQEPSDQALAACRALYDEACEKTGRKLAKKGHKDGYNTACPGTHLYAWVKAGMPAGDDEDAPASGSSDASTKATIKGVDVSAYQSAEFATKGAAFAFIKATEGRSYVNPRLAAQTAHARAEDLVVGFYHFLWPGNIKAQAEFFLAKAPEKAGDVLVVDWENTSEGTRATCAEKDMFIRELKKLRPSAKVLLYCNVSFWTTHDSTSYAGDGLWIADYVTAGKPRIKASWLIHQYTDKPLDTNVARFASTAAMKAWASGSKEEEKPEAKPKPKPKPPFPGVSYFGPGKNNAHVTTLGKQLVKKGYGKHYASGPGPKWSEADRLNVRDFQLAHSQLKGDADGIPGPLTWKLLFS